jgi:hypothetical protein
MKCLYSSFVFGLCGILSIVTNKKEEGYGMIFVSITSVLNHSNNSKFLIYLDRITSLSVGLYMTIFHFRYCYLVFGIIPLSNFLLRIKKEETLGLINQDEHFYKVHLPIILGFITIILN